MNLTQENREAIQQMLDADVASITDENQAALLRQALLNSALGPKSVRSANGEEIVYRSTDELISAAKQIETDAVVVQSQFGLRFAQIVPPGGGGTP